MHITENFQMFKLKTNTTFVMHEVQTKLFEKSCKRDFPEETEKSFKLLRSDTYVFWSKI